MTTHTLGDYAMLSDSHSAALVSRSGSIDWLCFPRFDAPSVFGRILDDDAGHWSLAPSRLADARTVERRYLDGTMVLETTFETDGGTLRVTDAMPFRHTPADRHDLGTDAPHALIRRATCTAGRVDVEMSYVPRPEYGLMVPVLDRRAFGVVSRGGSSTLSLTSPVDLETNGRGSAHAAFTLEAGDTAAFALRHRASHEADPGFWDANTMAGWLDETVTEWQQWSAQHTYDGPWADLVSLSGRVLQSLTYVPTGAIVAAPTTSLPETIGGARNWDYRYCWVRDASLTIDALHVAACPDEAASFFHWMLRTAGGDVAAGQALQIVYGIDGGHEIGERQLPHLDGWRDSRPVRVGNDAWQQAQLDVYGELLGAVHRSATQIGEMAGPMRTFVTGLADAAAQRWRNPDRGMWEVRGGQRHFTHSKLMCWVALDRAIELAPRLAAQGRVEGWKRTREEIRDAIERDGWSDDAGSFVQAFDGDDALDASVLMLAITGFLPADDERMLATMDAIERRLTDASGLVYRYRTHDGLPGDEGTFVLCTFWLAECLARAGRTARARDVFERVTAHANDLGLLAEEVHPGSGELLGNFPQAFSHIGLVNAAEAVHLAEQGA